MAAWDQSPHSQLRGARPPLQGREIGGVPALPLLLTHRSHWGEALKCCSERFAVQRAHKCHGTCRYNWEHGCMALLCQLTKGRRPPTAAPSCWGWDGDMETLLQYHWLRAGRGGSAKGGSVADGDVSGSAP